MRSEILSFAEDDVTERTRAFVLADASLGLGDTGFAATGDRAARIAEPQTDPATRPRPPMRNVINPGRWASGGGGAFSAAADYLRFCPMLLNGGQLDGTRVLARKTVALMASDHLPPDCNHGETARPRFGALAPLPEMGYGFGLGFAVRSDAGRCRCRARSANISGAAF